MEEEGEKPFKTSTIHNLEGDEVLNYFNQAAQSNTVVVSSLPPVLPRAGELYIFDLGPEESQWDNKKKKMRYLMYNSFIS